MGDMNRNSNLYIEAARVLHDIYEKKGSIKTCVHRSSYQVSGLYCTLGHLHRLLDLAVLSFTVSKESVPRHLCSTFGRFSVKIHISVKEVKLKSMKGK